MRRYKFILTTYTAGIGKQISLLSSSVDEAATSYATGTKEPSTNRPAFTPFKLLWARHTVVATVNGPTINPPVSETFQDNCKGGGFNASLLFKCSTLQLPPLQVGVTWTLPEVPAEPPDGFP